MANRYQTPVLFAMEKNIVYLSARFTFDAAGTVALDTNNSKGFCAMWQNTPTFSGATSSGSATITSVTSFAGLYTGMQLYGTSVVGSGSFTIGTISPSTGSIVLSKSAYLAAVASSSFQAEGGQYILQLGTQAATRLDTYFKLLEYDCAFDMSVGSAVGTLTQAALAPVCNQNFMIKNNTSVRTIPQTITSGSSDATITVQFGNGSGKGFIAADPAPGESGRIVLVMGNSSAI